MKKLILLMAMALPLAAGVNASNVKQFYARAFEIETGKLLYIERHTETFKNGEIHRCRVTYTAPDGRVIATKKLDFDHSPLTPSFELKDLRSGYVEGARITAGQARIYSRRSFSEPLEEKTVTTNNLVVDSGFDRFVRKNWYDLLSGKERTFAFAVPSEKDTFEFRVRKTASNDELVTFSLELSNPLFRVFVKPLILKYDYNRRLVVYQGISNINNDEGKSLRARIVFNYR